MLLEPCSSHCLTSGIVGTSARFSQPGTKSPPAASEAPLSAQPLPVRLYRSYIGDPEANFSREEIEEDRRPLTRAQTRGLSPGGEAIHLSLRGEVARSAGRVRGRRSSSIPAPTADPLTDTLPTGTSRT